MSIHKYEVFNIVVQEQNITSASAKLHLTQSAVSRAVKSLENDLNLHLLNRNRSGVSLTTEGEVIYNITTEIVEKHYDLLEKACALRNLEIGSLKVGVFASVATHWLPEILGKFKSKFPSIEIEFYENDYDSLDEAVLQGELDCCFTIASKDKEIEFIPLKRDNLFCIVSRAHPLYQQSKNKIKVKQLEQYPLIKPKSGWDNEVISFFNKYHLTPNVKYEISDDQSIFSLVQANLGINIRPGLVLTNAPDDIAILEFEEEAFRTIGLGTLPNHSLATEKFISIVKELFCQENLKSV